MAVPTNKIQKPLNGLLDFLKTNWMYILGLIFIVPYIKRYLDDAENERKIAQQKLAVDLAKQGVETKKAKLKVVNSDPKTQQIELNKITSKPPFQNIAKSIFNDMGLQYESNFMGFSWNPRGWSENDDDVIKALKPVKNKNDMFKIKQCYFVISSGRDMYNDLKTYLPASDFATLKNLI